MTINCSLVLLFVIMKEDTKAMFCVLELELDIPLTSGSYTLRLQAYLQHKKEELTLVELGIHLRIEESLRVQNSDKPKGNNVVGPSVVNMVEHNNSIRLKTLGERGIECIFVGYVEHSKAFRFYVIEPNESVSINSINVSRDAIFDENRFSSVPGPSQRSLIIRTEDIVGLVVPEKVTEEGVVQQHELKLRKSKRNRTIKNFGPEFQLYLIERTRDEISDQHSYCFNVEDDSKTFDESMKSQDGFRQKSVIDYFDTYALVARISTIRPLIALASIYSLIIHHMDAKTTFLNGELDEKVDLTKEFLSSRFFMKDMREADVILVSTPMDTSDKLMPNNGQAVSQLEYSRVISFLMYAMTCTRPDIDLQWASKNQTCITSSTMESKFLALVAAGKEAEWLRNLILKIPLWSKPIEPISIRCDSAATLVKAYSQMYNEKSRHLYVRHNMIRELITNGVVFIEFVRSQQNLANHLMKGLARDLVLKSNLVTKY
ncbi:zinc finger, CCHC-type containing protein [Tanacetum coccineum]